MTAATSPDRLREILDTVVASLEEDEVDGSELARRAFLSPFHFSRLVRASIGEPPVAFRRRLLLERAAYHLSATTAPVTEISFDAGYGSLEAFTRAFRRAFGRTPSEVRGTVVAAGQFDLPAPNGVHFHPPGWLRLPAAEGSVTMDLTDRMLEHDAWLVGQMLDLAGELTDAQLDQPLDIGLETIEEARVTLRDLLSRLVDTKERWAAAVEGRVVPPQEDRSLAGLRRRYAEAGPAFLRIVRDARRRGDEEVTFIDATCEPPETFTYGGVIEHVLTFSAFRRTLALSAFDLFGYPQLGSGDPRNWEPSAYT
jgi:AraC family transcriptional regulator